jgi:DNA-binding transcriptional MerR regulator
MEKSPDAFRTISEVADWLGVPTHVLRFWESRFPQVKPVKRAGGRRYYRPADMLLLGGIKRLLHDDGLTIRGVQKMLREEGVRHVSSFSQPLDATFPMRDVTPDAEDLYAPSPMAVDVEPEPIDNVVPLASGEEEEVPAAEAIEARPAEPGPYVLTPASAVRPAVPVEAAPDAGEEAPAPLAPEEAEVIPEFSFLHRSRIGEPQREQPDLFSSRRQAPAEAAPAPRPRIPPTPDVPVTDAPDDDVATPGLPGLAARLLVWDIRPDDAAIARAVAELRDLRARL